MWGRTVPCCSRKARSLPTRLQKVEGHWKVDPSAVIAGRKAAEAAQERRAEELRRGEMITAV